MYSKTKKDRRLQVYLSVMDKHGKIRRIKIASDTQSNVSYTKEHLGQKRSWRSHESKLVKGVGGYYEDNIPLTTYVIKGKNVVPLDTRSPPEHMFKDPNGPEQLLRVQHCTELFIDTKTALRSMRHQDVQNFLKLDPGRRKKPKRNLKGQNKRNTSVSSLKR